MATIEMLGVGVRGPHDRWLLHRVCARLDGRGLVAVVSARAEERHAFLDVVAGRRVPDEGRAWIGGVPLMADTARRVRGVVADVDLGAARVKGRSLLWSVLAASQPVYRSLNGFFRLPRGGERRRALSALAGVGLEAVAGDPVASLDAGARARLLLACGLVRRAEWLLVRDPDVALGPGAPSFLAVIARLGRSEQTSWIVSLADAELAGTAATRIVALREARLVFDGPADGFEDWRLSTSIHRNLHRHPR